MSLVCAQDGVAVATSRSGKLVHLDELPRGVEPHDVEPAEIISDLEWLRREEQGSVRIAAAEMLQHHSQFHPASDCPWAVKLAKALHPRDQR